MDTELQVWLDHFEYHATRRCTLPAPRGQGLTDSERRLIARSIATFQLGERSEGLALMRSARRYEAERSSPPLSRIVQLLISEEQHHAALLGAFMDQHGIPRQRKDWTDWVFRRVRQLAGFELHITVLVTAELIGKVYYRALEAATGCRQLQTLCCMLVADELAHVGFETDLLRSMHMKKAPFARAVTLQAHRAFLIGASLVVWLTHRKVLRQAGYRMKTFLRACAAQFTFYMEPRGLQPRGAITSNVSTFEDESHLRDWLSAPRASAPEVRAR